MSITEQILTHVSGIYLYIYSAILSSFNLSETITKVNGSVFVVVGILIFIEIIVINYCDLNVNTKKEIFNRGNNEWQHLQLSYDNLIDEEENEQLE